MAKVVFKGGPGSGHRGHSGRPGKRGGSVPGVGGVSSERAAEIATSIQRMMPYDNRKDLDIPVSGLPDARTKDGNIVDTIAYNPTTGDLLAAGGGELHADIIAKYSETMAYDDYVKVVFATPGPPSYLSIDIGRVTSEDATDAWNKGFDTAWALSKAGFPDDMVVKVDMGQHRKPGETGAREFILGDMKEVGEDVQVVEFTLGALVARYKVLKQLPINDESANNLIRARINIFYDESDNLARRMFTGEISLGQWQEDMKSLIREVHTSAAAIGGGGWDEMTSAQWGRLGTPMREQYRYLQGFSEFIDENKDTISLRAIQARSRLYGEGAGGSVVLMQAGPVLEGLLPFLPKDGSTPCLNRCHCRWELEVIGAQPDGSNEVQATWLLGVAEHCDVCVGRDGHVEMLVIPRDAEVPPVVGGIL